MKWLSPVCHDAEPEDFVPGACGRVEPFLLSEIVGQDLAVEQLSSAVCDHLSSESPQRPLVLSAHGPPGRFYLLTHSVSSCTLQAYTESHKSAIHS